MPSLVIEIPMPPRELHPNARVHHMAKARATKRFRWEVGVAAKDALQVRRNLEGGPPPGLPATHAVVTARFGFMTRRRRDEDNLCSWLKAGFDALQRPTARHPSDAGIVVDDSGLEHRPPQIIISDHEHVQLLVEWDV